MTRREVRISHWKPSPLLEAVEEWLERQIEDKRWRDCWPRAMAEVIPAGCAHEGTSEYDDNPDGCGWLRHQKAARWPEPFGKHDLSRFSL